jgi:16S rRNA (guanine966-N2)-methyltransferase
MRVIGGQAKGHTLKGPKTDATRPTSDKVRGAIFSMLEAMVNLTGARVLDLYAGTGALGIEALSRGAAWCDFVEKDRAACRIIADNLAHTRLAGQAQVHAHSVERVVSHPDMLLRRRKQGTQAPQSTPHFTASAGYDIILLDPPYGDTGVWSELAALASGPLATAGTLVVLEHSKRARPPEAVGCLALVKTRRHGDTCVSIFRHAGAPSQEADS